MKNVFLIGFFILLCSCGKNEESSSSILTPPIDEGRVATGDNPVPSLEANNQDICEDNTCYENISETTDIKLSEVVLDTQVSIEDEKIIVEENAESINTESSFECEIKFIIGDEYKYKVLKNKLLLEMNKRKYVFVKLGDDSESVFGTWLWRGKEDERSVMMTLSISSNENIILRKNCES